MRNVIIALATISWLASIAGFVQLRHLKRTTPEILRRAGIVEIDGLAKCVRGIYRLGFTSLGAELPLFTKTAFQFIILGYIFILAFGIATLNGYRL